MKRVVVPLLLVLSSVMMALAWIGHLRFEETWSFWTALAVSWTLVIPEYLLNTSATRWGYGTYSGAQMASVHLSSGVVSVALVSVFVLGEELTGRQLAGFALMLASMVLILKSSRAAS